MTCGSACVTSFRSSLMSFILQYNRSAASGHFAGENGEIGSAHAHVAGDAFHLGRTATVKVHHRPASAVPASPPMRKQANKAGPFAGLSRARHSSLHASWSVALLRVEPT